MVRVQKLSSGVRYRWLADCNVLLVSAALDQAGRVQAVTEWAENLRRQALAQLDGRPVRAAG